MILNQRSSTVLLSLAAFLLIPVTALAQQKKPQQSSKPQKPQKRRHYTPPQKPPPPQPSVLADGGWSLEPIYWLNRNQPDLRGGKLLVGVNGALDYLGHANPSIGGVLSLPAGKHNSLRFSYFRVQGHSDTTLTQNATLFTEGYNSGDFLNASYTLQVAKLSWDYLSYTWFFPKTKIWMKTLWEMQFANIGTNIAAPLKPVTTDVNGNVDYNTATGSAKVFMPTLGLEFEQPVTRHFRWWVKGSGFGIPHHGDIWDAEAGIGLRMGRVELIGGAKAFHFKTSPQGSQYFVDTLAGPFVGLRWYWTKRQQ